MVASADLHEAVVAEGAAFDSVLLLVLLELCVCGHLAPFADVVVAALALVPGHLTRLAPIVLAHVAHQPRRVILCTATKITALRPLPLLLKPLPST